MIKYIQDRGVKPFEYHIDLEIRNEKTPETWKNKLFWYWSRRKFLWEKRKSWTEYCCGKYIDVFWISCRANGLWSWILRSCVSLKSGASLSMLYFFSRLCWFIPWWNKQTPQRNGWKIPVCCSGICQAMPQSETVEGISVFWRQLCARTFQRPEKRYYVRPGRTAGTGTQTEKIWFRNGSVSPGLSAWTGLL